MVEKCRHCNYTTIINTVIVESLIFIWRIGQANDAWIFYDNSIVKVILLFSHYDTDQYKTLSCYLLGSRFDIYILASGCTNRLAAVKWAAMLYKFKSSILVHLHMIIVDIQVKSTVKCDLHIIIK